MTTMIEAALDYVKEGFKVFPVKLDKKPLTEHGLKDATQTQQGVKEYWTKWPDAGIGIVTDNLIVLDFDAKSGGLESLELIKSKFGLPDTRIHGTGGGGFHYIYLNPNGTNVRNATGLGGYPGVDLRAKGGYIVAPPSHHPSGNDYYIYSYMTPAIAPQWLMTMATKRQETTNAAPVDGEPIPEGQRNATLTKLAGAMRRQGTPADEIEAALIIANKRCQPGPLPVDEIRTIAKSVCRYAPLNNGNNRVYHNSPLSDATDSKNDRNTTKQTTKPLVDLITEWVKQSSGWFSYEDIDKEFGITTTAQKDNRWHIIRRLLTDVKIIESHPTNNKLYRYINTAFRLIDFKSADNTKPLAIKYPFGIENYFNTFPCNIVVVAGSPDAGKTAFLLNVIRLNQYEFSIYYQSSEMGKSELQNRLRQFEGIELQDWNFTAEERSSNFADVIRPGCVNIIDYLEISDNFFMVAEYLKQIHDKLDSGIAIVALQKDPKAAQGRGGTFGLEKPRLYLNMDAGKILIRKAKNWTHPEQNPNGLVLNYKLVSGCKFITINDWHEDTETT